MSYVKDDPCGYAQMLIKFLRKQLSDQERMEFGAKIFEKGQEDWQITNDFWFMVTAYMTELEESGLVKRKLIEKKVSKLLCPSRDLLLAYVTECLENQRRAVERIEEHLVKCESCQSLVSELRVELKGFQSGERVS